MGLSDEERIRNIINCVDVLTDIEPFTLDANDNKPQQINEILKDLWYDLFGSTSNSIHWFAGSSSDSITLKQEDPFGLAMIISHEQDSKTKSNTDIINDSIVDVNEREWYKYCNQYKPTALSLLKHHHSFRDRRDQSHDVLVIFKYIENYFYNVNRYDDKLSKSFEPLTKKISQLKGLCFKIMSKDSIFWKAYAAEVVFDCIITYHIDDINQWFKDNHMHHDVRLDRIDSNDLFKALSLAQRTKFNPEHKPLSANDRVVLILKFCGSKFHYKHKQLKLFKLIEKNNKEFEKDKINLGQVKKLCAKAELYNANKEKDNYTNKDWSCDLTGENFWKNDKAWENKFKKISKADKQKKI